MAGTAAPDVGGDIDHATRFCEIRRDGHVLCAVCGREGRFIRFQFLAWHRRARHLARLRPRAP